jgi:hypothetical protein
MGQDRERSCCDSVVHERLRGWSVDFPPWWEMLLHTTMGARVEPRRVNRASA